MTVMVCRERQSDLQTAPRATNFSSATRHRLWSLCTEILGRRTSGNEASDKSGAILEFDQSVRWRKQSLVRDLPVRATYFAKQVASFELGLGLTAGLDMLVEDWLGG